MATHAAAETESLPRRAIGFYHDVMAEMKKVTWPDLAQIRQATIGILVVVLLVGGVIALLDVVLQQVLVRGIPALFAR
jgi:preprotein translocase subunit SecE